MDGPEFRKRGREMVDYIVDYLDNIDARRVTPNIEPGYLQELIPREPPQNPEEWEDIMDDVEKKIMIGVSWMTGKNISVKPFFYEEFCNISHRLGGITSFRRFLRPL
jgi:hypothetical protein